MSLMSVCSSGLKVPRFECTEACWGLCPRLPICVRSGCWEVFRMLLCLPALAPHSFEVPSIQPVFTEHLCEPGVICGRCVSLSTWLQGVRPILGSAISGTGFEFLGGAGKSVVWVWSRAPWVTVPALPQMSYLILSKSLHLSGPQLTQPACLGRAGTALQCSVWKRVGVFGL